MTTPEQDLRASPPPRTRVPDGPSSPALVQRWRWQRAPLALLEEARARYGPVFSLKLYGTGRCVVVSEPEHVRAVFAEPPGVFSGGEGASAQNLRPLLGARSVILLDGQPHIHARRLLLPPLNGSHLEAMTARMSELTAAAVASWPLGTPLLLYARLRRLSLEVILATTFGVLPGPQLAQLAGAVDALLECAASPLVLDKRFQVRLGGLSRWDRFLRLRAEVDSLVLGEVRRRRQAGDAEGQDALCLLLQARGEDGEPLVDTQIRDHLMTLLVAGHDPTAVSLAWVFRRLLDHPDVAARLDAELTSVLGEEASPGPLAFQRLEYLDAVLKEAMRLHPILPVVSRRVKTPFQLDGYALEPGDDVLVSVHLAHRRAQAYPEPELFKPERFLGQRPDPSVWLPFGGGSRRCIGLAFAMHQMKVTLATVLRRVRVSAPAAAGQTSVRKGNMVVPPDGVPVRLSARGSEVSWR